jgi:hypothetical protein
LRQGDQHGHDVRVFGSVCGLEKTQLYLPQVFVGNTLSLAMVDAGVPRAEVVHGR